jgi:hypothetical protein
MSLTATNPLPPARASSLCRLPSSVDVTRDTRATSVKKLVRD